MKSSHGRPEIDRIQLRQLLLDALPKDMIRWNHKLAAISPSTGGKFVLSFRNEQPPQGDFDLVIGGDGCWSRVRRELTDELPHYSRIAGISFQLTNPQERCPDLYRLVDRGSLFSFADHRGLMAQQLGSGSLNIAYWAVKDEAWIKSFQGENNNLEAMKSACLDELEGWDPRLLKFIEMSDADAVSRNLYMLSVGNSWTNRPGITLLGDAAHVMTPFAGEGVNLAMSDAMKLAAAIESAARVGTTEALHTEIKAYEEDMFKRATVVQQTTFNMMSASLLSEGALDSNIEKYIMTAAGDHLPSFLMPVAWFVLRCYYGLWRWRNPPPQAREVRIA